MQERIVAFIAALRAAGVPVSLAESLDALRAIEQAGVGERALFRAALRATLVKAHHDQPTFERLFPLYFGGVGASLVQPDTAEHPLIPQLLEALGQQSDQPELAQLFVATVTGRPLGQEQLLALLARPTPGGLGHPTLQRWVARQAVRDLGLERLEPLLDALLARLRAAGAAEAELDGLAGRVRANRALLAEQLHDAVVAELRRQATPARRSPRPAEELLDQSLHALSAAEAEELRAAVARLAAQLRTRVSLRQRRDRRGRLNPRRTLRASLSYGGVPFALHRRRRRLQPRLVILCDVSSSMRAAAALMLMLVAAVHDQVRHTRAFAYIDELHDIGADFLGARPEQAIAGVLGRIPSAYARTDLGGCLEQFVRRELASVDRRTTVIVLGDGRNNGSDPGLDALRRIRSRAHRLLWLTPEPRRAWGTGDSAMLEYAPLCDAVHSVATLRQLGAALAHALEA